MRYIVGTLFSTAAGIFVASALGNLVPPWVCVSVVIAAVLLGQIVAFITLESERKSIKLTKFHGANFSISELGMSIPTFILIEPSRHRATRKGLAHILVPWSAVEQLSVRPGQSKGGGHFLIGLNGELQEFASGQTRLYEMKDPFLAVLRYPFQRKEEELLATIAHYLDPKKITIRDDLNK